MRRILIVEDEKNLAEGLKFNLEQEGYEVDLLEEAESAFAVFSGYHMMILDVMLPGMSGLELLEQVRKIDHKYPVLILSARSSDDDRRQGLAAGADDYVTKPFSLPELILRVGRMLERQRWYTEATRVESSFSFGKYKIDFDSFEAVTNKGPAHLTLFECYVMKYLIENRHRSVSRGELLEKVWGYSVLPETRTVDTFISRLRNLFEEDRKAPRHIVSIRNVGYRFQL